MILLDNTALSALAHIDRLDIPSKLFGETCIPECVYYEGVLNAKKLPVSLGAGERYVISTGISEKCLIATDDLKPRKIAKEHGLDIIGTLGILRLAYNGGLINKKELKEAVKKLHEILFFTDDLEKWVLSID